MLGKKSYNNQVTTVALKGHHCIIFSIAYKNFVVSEKYYVIMNT